MDGQIDKLQRWPRFRALRAANTKALVHADARLASPRLWAIAVTLVFLLQGLLIFTHRPWLDEIQALQLAVEAPDLATLIQWLRYEGHPPLFYLLLRGLAHLFEPLQTLPILAALLAGIVQGCILFRSPFTRAERLLIALGEVVMFEFLTLSRSLTLGVAVVILVASIWRSRWVWLAIALLPMCDFLFGVLSGIFVLLKLRERQLWSAGVLLWLLSGVTAGYLVLPAEDMLPAIEGQGIGGDLIGYLSALGTLALPFQGGILPQWNQPPLPLAGVLWIPVLLLCWSATRRDRLHRVSLFGFIALTLVFSLAVYPLAIRHVMLVGLLLIVLTWLRRQQGDRPQAGFRLWLTVIAVCGLATSAIAVARPFDSAAVAVSTIQRMGLTEKHWMVWPDSRAQVVAALSGIQFERTERHCVQTGIRWDYRTTLTTPKRLERYLASEVARHGRFYLLSDTDLGDMGNAGLITKIAAISPGYDGQAYYLYMIGQGSPERPVSLPPCMARRRPFTRL